MNMKIEERRKWSDEDKRLEHDTESVFRLNQRTFSPDPKTRQADTLAEKKITRKVAVALQYKCNQCTSCSGTEGKHEAEETQVEHFGAGNFRWET